MSPGTDTTRNLVKPYETRFRVRVSHSNTSKPSPPYTALSSKEPPPPTSRHANTLKKTRQSRDPRPPLSPRLNVDAEALRLMAARSCLNLGAQRVTAATGHARGQPGQRAGAASARGVRRGKVRWQMSPSFCDCAWRASPGTGPGYVPFSRCSSHFSTCAGGGGGCTWAAANIEEVARARAATREKATAKSVDMSKVVADEARGGRNAAEGSGPAREAHPGHRAHAHRPLPELLTLWLLVAVVILALVPRVVVPAGSK